MTTDPAPRDRTTPDLVREFTAHRVAAALAARDGKSRPQEQRDRLREIVDELRRRHVLD